MLTICSNVYEGVLSVCVVWGVSKTIQLSQQVLNVFQPYRHSAANILYCAHGNYGKLCALSSDTNIHIQLCFVWDCFYWLYIDSLLEKLPLEAPELRSFFSLLDRFISADR